INQVSERLSPLLNDASSNATQLPITFNSRPGTHSCPLVPDAPSLAYHKLIRTDKTHIHSDADNIALKLQTAFEDIDNQLEEKGRLAAERYQKT
ncbi:hypothetical protein, partial [Salmonella sp. s51228]|uniref:hypothetical protein n=1 Tax=Salmonella sp. s51228 TaxID=3159652 RepID=UPI00397F7B7C